MKPATVSSEPALKVEQLGGRLNSKDNKTGSDNQAKPAAEAELWQNYRQLFNRSRLYLPTLDPAVNRAYEAWYAKAFDACLAPASNVIPLQGRT